MESHLIVFDRHTEAKWLDLLCRFITLSNVDRFPVYLEIQTPQMVKNIVLEGDCYQNGPNPAPKKETT